MTHVDLSLYAIVDPDRSGGRDLAVLARQVVQGGQSDNHLPMRGRSRVREDHQAAVRLASKVPMATAIPTTEPIPTMTAATTSPNADRREAKSPGMPLTAAREHAAMIHPIHIV